MNAVITGANGDIGYAILNYLLAQSYRVLALDKNIERLSTTAYSGSELIAVEQDLTDSEKTSRYLKNIVQPVDVMIYAAGIREIVPIVDLDVTEWRAVMDANLTGAFIVSQHVARLAIEFNHPLCIIFISSISGLFGEPERSAYCASKHGLMGLAKSLAIELAPHAIRVNTIAPGVIESDLTRPYQAHPRVMEQLRANIPLARWGQPDHIVQAVDLLIKNNYMTGSTLVVDGGWTAGKKL